MKRSEITTPHGGLEAGVLVEPELSVRRDDADVADDTEAPRAFYAGARKQRVIRRLWILAVQLLIIGVMLAAWQWLPKIPGLSERYRFLDPFFISSPSDVARRVHSLAVGEPRTGITIWKPMMFTLRASFLGLGIGTVLGGSLGLAASNSTFFRDVLRPLMVAANSVPRIALIPIIVVIFGLSSATTVAVASLIVFFVTFFSAYEGGAAIAPHILENARILGASSMAIMWRVRFPYVLAWIMATLPVALSLALLSVITAELLTGYQGVGYLVGAATTRSDASLMFAVVVYLGTVGMLLVMGTDFVKRKVLHWWISEPK